VKRVTPEPIALTRHTPLPQPDRTTCGSCVLVMMRLLTDTAYAGTVLGSRDPATVFGRTALATRRWTSSARDRNGHHQLPWPASLGTRPAAMSAISGAAGSAGWSRRCTCASQAGDQPWLVVLPQQGQR
jgi:hypothetical protein